MRRVPATAGRAAVAVLLTAALAACSGGSTSSSGPALSSGDPSKCPGNVVTVVVSVSQWGDIVRDLGGDCATVRTLLASAAVDPHDYEPKTADIAAFSDADLVVVNGAGYDTWAADAVAGLGRRPPVVSAAQVAGAPSSGGNPHLWYSPATVPAMADAITEVLRKLSPDAAPYFDGRHTAWTSELQPYAAEVATLRAAAAGRTYAATETVFDPMAAALGLIDRTPPGYRRSTSNGSDPAPGDLAAFEAALADRSVDVLIDNTQTEGTVPAQLRSAAEKAGVPVVAVTESPPDAEGSFVAWQLGQLQKLSDALGVAR